PLIREYETHWQRHRYSNRKLAARLDKELRAVRELERELSRASRTLDYKRYSAYEKRYLRHQSRLREMLVLMVVLINVTTGHRQTPGLFISTRIGPLLSTYETHLNLYRHNHHQRHRYLELEREVHEIQRLERELLDMEASGVGLLEPDYLFDAERRIMRHQQRLAEILA
ncbi:unnamed protein product, partial [Oppiella nova]